MLYKNFNYFFVLKNFKIQSPIRQTGVKDLNSHFPFDALKDINLN